MKVFVTGATGFVGSAVVRELLGAGHEVLGLARSDTSAAALAATGAEVLRGSLHDLDSLRSGVAASDGVIHTAFIHDFSDMAGVAQVDRQAIQTLCTAVAGSDRPFIMTSGTAGIAPGRLATEEDESPEALPRGATERMALAMASEGVRVAVVRLPPSVHGEGDHGFIPQLINIAREKGVSAYTGDGSNRWASVHRLDAAHLYRLALENAVGGFRYHGVADEGIMVRDIAEVIGRQLNLPVVSVPAEKTSEHFGWIGLFFSMDLAASSALTQQRLGWHPVGPSLLADLNEPHYFNQ